MAAEEALSRFRVDPEDALEAAAVGAEGVSRASICMGYIVGDDTGGRRVFDPVYISLPSSNPDAASGPCMRRSSSSVRGVLAAATRLADAASAGRANAEGVGFGSDARSPKIRLISPAIGSEGHGSDAGPEGGLALRVGLDDNDIGTEEKVEVDDAIGGGTVGEVGEFVDESRISSRVIIGAILLRRSRSGVARSPSFIVSRHPPRGGEEGQSVTSILPLDLPDPPGGLEGSGATGQL